MTPTVAADLAIGQIPSAAAGGMMEPMATSSDAPRAAAPVVIRISPMAHVAVAFLTLALLAVILAGPGWFAVLFLIPALASALVMRLRTTADRSGVTARRLFGSQTIPWDDIDGLRFGRGSWAVARRRDDSEVTLPAVTFATLPQLTEASGGRVPNPYERPAAAGGGVDG
jgi:hypothetical protein